jgi:hypothetical protein
MIKSRRMRWVGHVVHMGEMRNVYNTLVGKPEGKTSLRRPRHRWEDNIKINLMEIGLEGVDWIHLAQNREWWQALVNIVMNLQVPYKVGNFLTERTISFSRRTLLHGVSQLVQMLKGAHIQTAW